MDRGAWWAIVHGVTESATTEQHAHRHTVIQYKVCVSVIGLFCL